MKPFESYQLLDGETMTDRDKKQVGSKFWGKGKWDNFVLPHLPTDYNQLSLVDMGCNAGLFLRFAKDLGFNQVIGVDSNTEAINRGIEWRDKHGYKYELIKSEMEKAIDILPIVDYTVLSNAHYYFTINNWIDYLDKLRLKTRFVIIVTADKHHINRCWASADVESIRNYFKDWEEVSFVDELPLEGDPDPRRLWSLCFKNPNIERVSIESLDSSNHVQDEFYKELDSGKSYSQTKYYKIIEKYRRAKWSPDRLERWFNERVELYEKIKKEGQTQPILVDGGVLILDGNHRYSMLKSLGNKYVFIRRV
jgi:hypothetical protein